MLHLLWFLRIEHYHKKFDKKRCLTFFSACKKENINHVYVYFEGFNTFDARNKIYAWLEMITFEV